VELETLKSGLGHKVLPPCGRLDCCSGSFYVDFDAEQKPCDLWKNEGRQVRCYNCFQVF